MTLPGPEKVLAALWAEFAGYFSWGQPLNWLCLLSAVTIGACALGWRDRAAGRRSLRDLLGACFPRRIYRHASAMLDVRYFLLNFAVLRIFVTPVIGLVLASLSVAELVRGALVLALGTPLPRFAPGAGADVLLTLLVVLAADFAFYLAHRLHHRIGWLWEFHKVHHAAEVLTPITAYRIHPVESAITIMLQGVATGVVFGAFAALVAGEVSQLQLVGTNAVIALYQFSAANLQHSHVWISYGPALNRVLVSPAHHQLHHSREARHRDRNLGIVFSFWDVLFGTHYAPDRRETFGLGLPETAPDARYESLASLYLRPFLEVGRRLAGSPRARRA